MLLHALLLVASVASAQSHYVEIEISPGIVPEKVFIRYRLDDDGLGGWVKPRAGVSSYRISTLREGRPSARIRALLYPSGCGIQTLELALSGSKNEKYTLTCKPLPVVTISGVLTHQELLQGREFILQAKYVARWAQPFFGFDPQLITAIPVGEAAETAADGSFRLDIPDFTQDSPGEIQIWARDKRTAKILAQLLPTASSVMKSRMGGLKIGSDLPAEIVFVPCTEHLDRVQDEFGFTLRPSGVSACNR